MLCSCTARRSPPPDSVDWPTPCISAATGQLPSTCPAGRLPPRQGMPACSLPSCPAVPDRPIVVAHSAAGLLLPALARMLNAAHQVWLAAAVADYAGRRSLLAEIQQDPLDVMNPEWLGIDPTGDPVLATYFLFHDADLATLPRSSTDRLKRIRSGRGLCRNPYGCIVSPSNWRWRRTTFTPHVLMPLRTSLTRPHIGSSHPVLLSCARRPVDWTGKLAER